LYSPCASSGWDRTNHNAFYAAYRVRLKAFYAALPSGIDADYYRKSISGKSERPPERFAQKALGHNSKAAHRAYAKRALMKIPSLEDYEQRPGTKAEPAA